MFRSFVCGSNYGKEKDDDDDDRVSKNKTTPPSMPRRQRKRVFCRSRKYGDIKNPYASSGLDKFSALMADLEEKRQKISSKTREATLVRFVCTSSLDLVPIVVKAKSRNNHEEMKRSDCMRDKHVILSCQSETADDCLSATDEAKEATTRIEGNNKSRFLFQDVKPSSHIVGVVILVLILLAFFGRIVAIVCSAVALYTFPALRRSRSNLRN